MKKILFVCLGNICRSPLAEGILRHKLNERRIDALVDSAGVGKWHIGSPPDRRAIKEGINNGIDISELVARQFSQEDFDRFDKIYVVDKEVQDSIYSIARNDDDKNKVEFMMNTVFPGKSVPVPDPYFGSDDGFTLVYEMMDQACEIIAENISRENKL